ncbi:hypothetical protein AS149_36975 [Burkholderia cenocepacia]|nr:hypothetical protein AS149_36975 [Burkholderia cenocepacia]
MNWQFADGRITSADGNPVEVTQTLLAEIFEMGVRSARNQVAHMVPEEFREAVHDAVGDAEGEAVDCTRVQGASNDWKIKADEAAGATGTPEPTFWSEHLEGGLDELDNLPAAIGPSDGAVSHDAVKAITSWLRTAAAKSGHLGNAFDVDSKHDFNYFRLCIGHAYTPVHLGKHEAIHPIRVKEVLASVAGTRAADVIASLVFDIEIRSQRERRMGDALFQHARQAATKN